MIHPIMSSAWSDGVLLLALTTVTGKLTVHTQTACRKIRLLQESNKLCPSENKQDTTRSNKIRKQGKVENLKYPENCQFSYITTHFIKTPVLSPLQNPDQEIARV